MIKVAALTAGQNVPSTRFRIRQFVKPLANLGVSVREYRPCIGKYDDPPLRVLGRFWTAAKLASRLPALVSARGSDVVWLERELFAGRFTLERFLPRRSVLDVDDAVWLTGQASHSERIAGRCLGVIAGNSYIADHYRPFTETVWVVPTCVDTEVLVPPVERPRTEEWTIGWTGSSSTVRYLADLEEPLADFLAERRGARLLVVCDRAPHLRKLPQDRIRYERWSFDSEVSLLQQMDVGLMPLPDSDWARGKCALKMLLYMAVGIPAVVSPIGVGSEILAKGEVGLAAASSGEWFAALRRLFDDRDAAARMGREGRRTVERFYSVKENADVIACIFQELAQS